MKKPKSKAERTKRYYLHARLKGVCSLSVSKRTISCKPEELAAISANKYVASLVNDYGYSIQLSI